MSYQEEEEVTANDDSEVVESAEAIDWLIRGAVPIFLELLSHDETAAWFRNLPPFSGQVGECEPEGWEGARLKLKDAALDIRQTWHRLVDKAAVTGHNIPCDRQRSQSSTDAQREVQYAADFARQLMAPCELGDEAFRLIAQVDHFTMTLSPHYDAVDGPAATRSAWLRAHRDLSDRAVLQSLDPDRAR